MNHKVINIDIDYEKLGGKVGNFQPTMTLYLPDNSPEIDMARKRPTVIICPGGGYHFTSDREAEPVALKFAAEDSNAIVLRYSVAPRRFPTQIMEMAKVIATVRENAEQWNVDTDKIVVLGFSAGGHLCASYGTLWNRDFVKDLCGYTDGEHTPNGMILCYPVITGMGNTHKGSFEHLLGEGVSDAKLLELVSAERQVNEDTPPAFIWHTWSDPGVPAARSIDMAAALTAQGIPTEMHLFPRGPHGISLANDTVYKQCPEGIEECREWIDLAIRWLKNL
jgi:acetyl esterase/lipase